MTKLMKRTFEQFMQDVHSDLFPNLLDDDIPDHFNDWIGEQDGSNIMDWAELYGREQYLAGKKEVLDMPTKI